MTEIADADQNRGAEFEKLLGQWNVRLAVGLPALLIGIACAVTEPVAGLIIFAGLLLIGTGIVFWMADRRAGKSFYLEYAEARNFVLSEEPLGRQTELLRSGVGQVTTKRWDGQLAPDLKGSLAHWSYATETTDSNGGTQNQWHDRTIVMIPLETLSDRLIELDVNFSSGSTDGIEKLSERASKTLDSFTGKVGLDLTDRNTQLQRLALESQELDEMYDVFIHESQDANFVRQLFSPSFIVWLTEFHRPFQFGRGVLVTSTGGHTSSAAVFDHQISGACEIARKLSAEAQEGR